jgi:hypothetical protein
MLLHDVGIIEQPVARRTYVDSALRCVREPVVNFGQYLPGVIEPVEERTMSPLPARWKQAMLACDAARMSREAVCAKNFTAYRSNQLSVCSVVTEAQKAENPALAFLRGNYSRCHDLLPRP